MISLRFFALSAVNDEEYFMNTTIIVHGGAGAWDLRAEQSEIAVAACREAAAAGGAVLQAGGSALDAVEAAVRILEDCPVLDAGRGSYFNQAGEVEMDALIMDGATLDLGCLSAVKNIRYPISLARKVMSESPHAFFTAHGASAFADSIGFPRCDPAELVVDSKWQALDVTQDTVGAVAVDTDGNVAAGTSTGGTRGKMIGRIGDSPLVGSGGYADNRTAAVSSTGHGESLMKMVICRRVCEFIERGMGVQVACQAAVDEMKARVDGEGGLIAVTAAGEIGIAFNTVAMPHAIWREDAEIVSGFSQRASQ